jgi:hypothetical protein
MVKKNKDKEEKLIKPISLSFGDALDKIINADKNSKTKVEVRVKKKDKKQEENKKE